MTEPMTAFSCTSRTSLISMRVIRTLVHTVAETGVSETRFLHAAKLHAGHLRALDERVPRSKLYELIELALELTGDPALGLHSVERLRTDALDPIAGLVVHAATLQDAMKSIDDFAHIVVARRGGSVAYSALGASGNGDSPVYLNQVASIVDGRDSPRLTAVFEAEFGAG